MIKKIMLLTVAISTAGAVYAAPPRNQDKDQRPDERRQAPAKPQAKNPAPAKPAPAKPQAKNPAPANPAPAKPAPAKPAPAKPLPPPPAPVKVVAKPLPPPPAPAPVVVSKAPYRQVRNTYTIQLNPDKTIIFEQRYVGIQELRDKIRMVKYDHPLPHIRIKVVEGVDAARLNFALDELKKAGFHNVEIIRLNRRTKFVPQPHIPGKRIKR